jgi:hypothetical protein
MSDPSPRLEAQSAAAVLMVRPSAFGFNPETAASNAFQRQDGAHPDLKSAAAEEFDAVVAALRQAGIEVLVVADSESPVKPDAIFPNNWVSFHHDGTVTLYPMLAVNRRAERREEILEEVTRQGGFGVSRVVDLSHRENEGKYLEGTGSMVLDRSFRTAYACVSPRTDLDVLGEFAQQLDYDLVTFDALDTSGQPIYHTNVMMALGTGFAVICGECIESAARREAVMSKLRASRREIVEISHLQMQRFAGNVLELSPPRGPVIVLSKSAFEAFDPEQRSRLAEHASLLPVGIPMIERYGGGGIRCMLAEIHLPKRRMS